MSSGDGVVSSAVERTMNSSNGNRLPPQQEQKDRHCPRCNRQPHLLTTLLDTRTGKTVGAPNVARSPRKISGVSPGGGRWRRDEAELLKHREPVEHQVERDVLAVPEPEHLNVR